LSTDKLGYFWPTSTDESRKREYSEPAQTSKPGLHLKRNFETRHGVALLALQESSDLPALNKPGFFIDSAWPSLSENRGRTPVQRDTDDEFHDSDIDIFALFNACDGIICDGFLDVSELDKYSPADAEALNVPRLREIWEHTTTGCPKCREIIEALQDVRGAVRDAADTVDQDDGTEQDLGRIGSNC